MKTQRRMARSHSIDTDGIETMTFSTLSTGTGSFQMSAMSNASSYTGFASDPQRYQPQQYMQSQQQQRRMPHGPTRSLPYNHDESMSDGAVLYSFPPKARRRRSGGAGEGASDWGSNPFQQNRYRGPAVQSDDESSMGEPDDDGGSFSVMARNESFVRKRKPRTARTFSGSSPMHSVDGSPGVGFANSSSNSSVVSNNSWRQYENSNSERSIGDAPRLPVRNGSHNQIGTLVSKNRLPASPARARSPNLSRRASTGVTLPSNSSNHTAGRLSSLSNDGFDTNESGNTDDQGTRRPIMLDGTDISNLVGLENPQARRSSTVSRDGSVKSYTSAVSYTSSEEVNSFLRRLRQDTERNKQRVSKLRSSSTPSDANGPVVSASPLTAAIGAAAAVNDSGSVVSSAAAAEASAPPVVSDTVDELGVSVTASVVEDEHEHGFDDLSNGNDDGNKKRDAADDVEEFGGDNESESSVEDVDDDDEITGAAVMTPSN